MAEARVSARSDERFHPPVTGVRGRWWVFVVAVAVLLVPAYLLLGAPARNVLYVGVGLGSVALVVLGVLTHRPPRARAWWALAVSQLLWVTGDLAGVLGLVSVDDYPTVVDYLYLLGYVPLGLFLFWLTLGRRPPRDWPGRLDAGAASLVLYLLCWVLLSGPTADAYAASWPAAVVGAATPILDVTLLAMLTVLSTVTGVHSRTLVLVSTALLLAVVADVGSTALGLFSYDGATLFDPFWMLAYLAFAAAALHPSMVSFSRPQPTAPEPFGYARLIVMGCGVLVGPLVLVGQHLAGRPIDVWPIALTMVGMVVLVVARMSLVIREILSANASADAAQSELAYRAAHDALTGLPNRPQTLQLVEAALARGQRSGTMTGLLFVDLDGFKAVNDTYGHAAGDVVLRAVAERMPAAVRGGDVVGRLGGDEFVVVLEPLVDEQGAVAVAQRLIKALAAPIPLGTGRNARIGASIGVAVSQDAGTDAEALMAEADVAAYRAKRMGRGRLEVFDARLRAELSARAEAEQRVRVALDESRLVLRYVPVVRVGSLTDLGYEAIVHWFNPGGELEPVPELRGAAESSDLIFEVDAWALQRAARQVADWASVGLEQVRVSVRVATRHAARQRILGDVRTALRQSGVDPYSLVVQLSDRGLVDDAVLFGFLSQLLDSGVTVSLDDFGVGYTSLRRLAMLPVGAVKLDASLLEAATAGSPGLLQLTVQGVRGTGTSLVVKGVRTQAQLELLHDLGVELVQGELFGPALSPDEVTLRLVRQAAPSV